MTNAILTIKQDETVTQIPVTWSGQTFEEDNEGELYDKLFCSDEIIDWNKEYPDMDVYLVNKPEIKSRVMLWDEASMFGSTKSLEKLLANTI